ncbi:chemotaxis protein CheC [Caldalkalibacillus uzonensis]|uniref:Chemotaxis protein CheC n=1 Tax=Caldalkalibacillus uzonensis TaxID=353224 RepID=A0ABU0CLI6_9BACI|nr:chemotaxis protein CheC [Caldalkalibacillus uzonensis]MDQ0337286.1 chemotaxis protein CheC [Caldalkalibacillus uzonensis]
MNNWKQFSKMHMDILKEIGNIGAGHAATSLSSLLQKPVEMKVPDARLVSFNEISERLGGAEQVVVTTLLTIQGDVTGYMFFILQQDGAKRLIHSLLNQEEADSCNELHLSAVQEVGNILSGSYLSALADLTGLNIQPSVPEVAIDMAAAILSYGLLEVGKVGDHALVIDTCFYDRPGQERPIEGHFFLLPDPDSFSILFQALGVTEHDKGD